MLAFVYTFIFLAATGGHDEGGFISFYNKYLNYPGFEAWKFVNVTVFVLILVYLLKKPLSEAFKAKREAIRADLIRAEEEKKAALEKLTAAEARLVTLEQEKKQVLTKAQKEAEAEKARIAGETKTEVAKLRQQIEAEIARISYLTRNELKRFSAEESIRLAEEKLRGRIDNEKDAMLIRSGIQAIGGAK